jgi:hypothetical protein
MELNDFKRNYISRFILSGVIMCAFASSACADMNQKSACHAELINRIEAVVTGDNSAKRRSLVKASLLEGPLKSKKYGLYEFYRYLIVVSLMNDGNQRKEYYEYDVDCVFNKGNVIGIELHYG